MVSILDVGVSALNVGEALEVIDRWIGTRGRYYVTVTGVHGIVESYSDAQVRRIHNEAGLVTPDGMPLVWYPKHWSLARNARILFRTLLVDRLRHLVPAMSLSADSNGGQAATIGWESSEPVAPLGGFASLREDYEIGPYARAFARAAR